jgi:hypothetical protein
MKFVLIPNIANFYSILFSRTIFVRNTKLDFYEITRVTAKTKAFVSTPHIEIFYGISFKYQNAITKDIFSKRQLHVFISPNKIQSNAIEQTILGTVQWR